MKKRRTTVAEVRKAVELKKLVFFLQYGAGQKKKVSIRRFRIIFEEWNLGTT